MTTRPKRKGTSQGSPESGRPSAPTPLPAERRTLARSITQSGPSSVPAIEGAKLPETGDVVGGHYLLLTTLGAGNFGRVYVAVRTDVPEHRVALKAIHRAVYAGRNVERELVMLAAAGHPNIVELKDHGVTDDYVWLTMPLYEGETLASRLQRGALTLREAYEIFRPIARGIEALHARGLRHQDIKPDNIFLANFAGQLHPVLLDLGVAAEKRSSFVAGTEMYASPEQVSALTGLSNGSDLSEKIDTYCLASTLLYALAGETHYPVAASRTPFDMAAAFEERERQPLRADALPKLTGSARTLLNAALGRWLTRLPDERPTMGELATGLDVLLEREREAARQSQRRADRQRAALQRGRVALAALAVTIIGGAYYAYTKRQTLELAGELERARAQEAVSFDELDTCNAAHQLATRQGRACVAERARESDDHGRELARLRAQEERDREAATERVHAATVKLRSCEDMGAKLVESYAALEAKRDDEEIARRDERRKLEEERDHAERERQSCAEEVDRLTRSQAVCRQELATCAEGPMAGTPSALPARAGAGDPPTLPYPE